MSLTSQQGIHILHVDDEPDFADLTGTFLEREDDRFAVEMATSADEGLQCISDRPPDCVVSDYNMPGMDGLEFLQAVREDNPDLPFILYTGKGSEEVASEAISSGVTDYLQKGSGTGQYELLANRISNAVEQHQAKRRVEMSHQAMDTANEGLSLVRPDGTFSYVNPAFAQLFEYNPDELIGEQWTVLYHNEQAERLDNDILPAVMEHGYWSGETVRLTKQEDRLVTDHRLSRTAEDVIVCTAQDVTPERTGSTGQSGELDPLVDTMEGHAFYALDHEGYVTSWNEGAERLTGYSATEILGAHVGQFFTEEDRDRGLPEELIETAKTDGTVTDHGWRVRNDGSQIRTADTISASYDASGTIRGFGVLMRESTTDPIAEELHRKTDYLDVIMEDSVQPLFMKDASGEYLLANREFKQLFDIQEETVIGQTDYDIHPEETAEEVWANDRHVLETEEPIEIEERAIVDGEERIYLSSKVPVYFDDDSDDPDAVFGMATDITERKEREQELRRNKRAMDEAPVGITITDPGQEDNPIIYANNGFRSLTGYADDEILGHNCRFMQGEDTSPESIATLREAVNSEERVTVQLRNYRNDGTEFWNRVSIAPVRDDEGSVVNFVGFQQDITDNKQRELELERARDLLDQTERLADVGGWEIDTETMAVHWTENLFDLLGVDYDEEPPLDEALNIYHEDDRPLVENAVETALDAGEPFDVEARFYRPDGELRWLRVQGTPKTDDGSVVTLRGTVQDITEQKQLERDLRQERDLVTGIVETSPVGIAVLNPDGEFSFVNDQAKSIYRRPLEEIEAMSHDDPEWDLVNEHGDPLEAGDAPFDRVISRETTIRDHVVGIRRPSGERVWLSVSGAPQWDENGELERAVFAFEDITEQRELEAEFEEMLGRVSDAFYALDDEFRFTHVNGRAEELLQASEDELLGETLWEMYPEAADLDKIWDAFQVAMDTQTLQSLELYYEPLDFWVEATVYPSESGISVYFRDVTDQKEHERKLETKNERLDEFASIVSHDLRNPLQVADGRLELIREECESDHINDVARALDRIDALIEDLLTLAREGEQVDDIESVGVANVAKNSWQTVNTEQATLEPDTSRTVEADQSRLRQLFENLYRNAVDHGGDDVRVSVGTMEDGFYVADTGSGIPEGEREEIFEAGYSTSDEGTGFGLRIVEQIADAHGWEITVTESEQGGARFDITGVEFADR